MIEIKDAVFPSTEQWSIVIHGMRNPYNSWMKRDSGICNSLDIDKELCYEHCPHAIYFGEMGEAECQFDDLFPNVFVLGKKDLKLAKNLINSGVEHAKFLRQLPIIFDIKAPLYWWKQCDQYKVGTTTDSCSTMHKLTGKEFEVEDFSIDVEEFPVKPWTVEYPMWSIQELVGILNHYREEYLKTKDRTYWNAINKLLPQSYNQLRTWSANYAVLFNICAQRAGHPLKEWNDFIYWIVENVPYFKELCFDKLCQVSKPFKEMFEDE